MLTKRQLERIQNDAALIRELDPSDPEHAHGEADKIVYLLLRDLGALEVTDALTTLENRCDWWATA